MLKRMILTVALAVFILGAASCGDDAGKGGLTDSSKSGEASHVKSNLFGYIVYDNADIDICTSMHGFIATAAELEVNAKLYGFTDKSTFDECVESAIADNCDAILIYAPDIDAAEAVRRIESQGIRAVTMFAEYDDASCCITKEDNTSDILKILADKTEGTILIYASEVVDISGIAERLKNDGYNRNIVLYTRSSYAYKEAGDELLKYIQEYSGEKITAIYAIGDKNARPAALAAKGADHSITVIGCGITEVNEGLYDSGIYALAVCPWYEITAEALHAMKNAANGIKTDDFSCTDHIVTEDKLEKYVSIRESAAEWFNLAG